MRTFSVSTHSQWIVSCLPDEIDWLFITFFDVKFSFIKSTCSDHRNRVHDTTGTTGNGIQQLDDGLLTEFTNKKNQ